MEAYKDTSGLTFLQSAGVQIIQIKTIEHV
jgi:hypothetical protein